VIDEPNFRKAIAQFASGVTVVTTRTASRSYGMTLSAMTSLSVEPPTLLICVNRKVPTEKAITDSGFFVVNVLADYQERLARQFAKPAADKFDRAELEYSRRGIPILRGALAHFECSVRERMPGGSHSIFIGTVESAQVHDHRRPLVYHAAGFGEFNCRAPSPVPVTDRELEPANIGAFFSS
jgi:flavin reductase (DIM6/NTAB) family NADH-FMN oxidoreductase RutF